MGCVSPVECLSEQNACIEGIPFVINRMNNEPVRSFSVTLTLSEELELCEGPASIHEGAFLGEGFTTEFLVVQLDPQTYEVRADGQLLTCEPAKSLPLAQRYFLF